MYLLISYFHVLIILSAAIDALVVARLLLFEVKASGSQLSVNIFQQSSTCLTIKTKLFVNQVVTS